MIENAIKRLQEAYKQGLIIYPRVDNDYLRGTPYAFFPHPPLRVFDEFSTPLKEKVYPLDKDTLLLYLCNKRIIKASIAQAMYNFADKIFDNNLEVKKELENDIKHRNKEYHNFLSENSLTPSSFYAKYFFAPRPFYTYKIKNKKLKKPEPEKDFMKTKTKIIDYELEFKERKNFFEALEDFQNRRRLQKYLLRPSLKMLNDC
ncbi:hypothetical protein [Caminibacter pacificus]|uniref:Uncharacterized protein n=1 Tax=Caminibacter pacificus TaxID=1424653 RepID=A0AAJ4RB19_9BACT|nr:hypothetical protein [Caminibacter pacificus]QDD68178.1 hypothetical protein C6V80_10005 [Caminibacter pacificus]ROR38691.1 hypothetical protein EDC58_1906 [Caminibacter pacificus]